MPFEIQDEFDDAALWGALDNAPQPRAPPRAPPQPPQPRPQPQSHGDRPQVPHLPHPPGPSWHPQNQNQQPPFPAAGRAALDLRAAGDRRDAYPGVASSSQKGALGPPGGAPRGGAHPPLDASNYHRVLGPSAAVAAPRTDKTVGPSAPSRPRKSVRVELALSPHARRVLVLLPPGFFDPELVRVLKTIPNASFDEVSRRWSFPDANLPDAARALKSARDLAVETVAPSPIAARALQAVVAVEKALARDAEKELGLVVSGCGVLPTQVLTDNRGARCGATATQRTDLTEECSTEETPEELPLQERDPGALGFVFRELHSKHRSTISPSANEESRAAREKGGVAGNDFSGASPLNAPTNVSIQKTSPLSVEDLASAEVDRLYAKIPGSIRDAMFPFQREGVRFALRRGGRCLIGDQMGLGKTVQAIAIAACYREEWPVLILVPTSLRGAWEQALVKWLGLEPSGSGHGLGGGKKEAAESRARLSKSKKNSQKLTVAAVGSGAESRKIDGATFAIVPYSLVGKLAPTLLSKRFQVVVCDESHFLKDSKAQRTKAVVPLLKGARRALCLTGTPALSRPVEIFSQAEALRPMVFTKFGEFATRYCAGSRFGWQGSSNGEELHAVLSRLIMIRRLKKDVLTQLPAKSREKIVLTLPHSAALSKVRAIKTRMDELRDAFLCEDKGFSGGFSGGGRTLEEKRLMNELYQATALAKGKAAAEYLETLLDSSGTPFGDSAFGSNSDSCEKFLFFGHHSCMLDAASEMLRKKKTPFIRIDGSTDPNKRQSLVDRFQTDPNARVAVLSIKAAGMGLTLTAASVVVFGELTWTPGDIVQAEDRAHRIGQRNAVNVQFLVAKDTVDDIMWGSVANKLETLGVVLDGVRGDALEMKKCSKTCAPDRTREQRLETLVARGDRSPGGRLLDFSSAGRETGLGGSGSTQSGTPKRQGTLDAFVQPKASTAPPPPPPAPAWLPPPEWDEPDDACLLQTVSTLEAKRRRLE